MDDSTAGHAIGAPWPWEIGFQFSGSPIKAELTQFNTILTIIISLVVLVVLGLLVFVLLRFNARHHPTPSRRTHNTPLEVIWTLIPVLILAAVAVLSLPLLFHITRIPNAEMTLKITGNQWFWSYQYPDDGGFGFDSYMIDEKDLKPGQLRLLETANHVVLPIDTVIQLQITSADVIHSWLVPSLGVQMYAVPGRLNGTWVRIDHVGVYYGQCNQICGVNHGFMPIEIEAIPKAAFAAWVAQAKKNFARTDMPKTDVRLAEMPPQG
jgi:cytochrome c oxidase subunit II